MKAESDFESENHPRPSFPIIIDAIITLTLT
jgi:hypothetical protein